MQVLLEVQAPGDGLCGPVAAVPGGARRPLRPAGAPEWATGSNHSFQYIWRGSAPFHLEPRGTPAKMLEAVTLERESCAPSHRRPQ